MKLLGATAACTSLDQRENRAGLTMYRYALVTEAEHRRRHSSRQTTGTTTSPGHDFDG